jgi:hypothetical protein
MSKKKTISAEAVSTSWDPTTGAITTSSKDYSRPSNYSDKVKTVWNDYDADPQFQYLIDRLVHFGVNGTRWDMEDKSQLAFWNEWGRRVNGIGSIDIIPGLDEVEKWICKNLSLGAMAAMEWDRGSMSINKKIYKVPVNITIYPATWIELKNDKGTFGKNEAWLKVPGEKERKLGSGGRGGFVLKLNYSPADLSASGKMIATSAGSIKAEPTFYPKPPFFNVHEDIETRLKLREVDRSTVADLINIIWYFKIGDKDNPPEPPILDETGKVIKKGTIGEMADSIKDDDKNRSGGTRTLFLPYYVELKNLLPEVQVLLNYDKYIAPTINLLAAFGIFVSPGKDTRLNFTDINTQDFEQFLDFIRVRHIGRFIEGMLCAEIVRENSKVLTEIPSLRWNVLNTKTDEFRKYILELVDRGRMSSRVATEVAGLNYKNIISDLASETGIEKPKNDTELFNAAVTVRFKQGVVNEQSGPVVKKKTGGE